MLEWRELPPLCHLDTWRPASGLAATQAVHAPNGFQGRVRSLLGKVCVHARSSLVGAKFCPVARTVREYVSLREPSPATGAARAA